MVLPRILKVLSSPAFAVAFGWAYLVNWTLRSYLIADGVGAFAVRAALMTWFLTWLWRRAGERWSSAWSLVVTGITLVPLVALTLNGDYVSGLSRATVVAASLIFLGLSLLRENPDRRQFRIQEVIYFFAMIAWGWFLCRQIADQQASFTGWLWQFDEGDLMAAIGDDGQQYIALGASLRDLFSTMHRLPGFPLLTRALLFVIAPNFHVLIFANILALMATVHFSLCFIARYWRWAWSRVILLAVYSAYLHRIEPSLFWYQYVLTDPLNDLFMVLHVIWVHDFLRGQTDRLQRIGPGLLAAFLLRPTIAYYGLALTAALYFLGPRAQRKNVLLTFVLWLIVPMLTLMTFNRVRHGVFAFSSMQSHLMVHATYATMLSFEHGLTSEEDAMKAADQDYQRFLAQARDQGRTAGLSPYGVTTKMGQEFALEKFREKPELFLRTLGEGVRQLLMYEGERADVVIVALAILLCGWSWPWMLGLLWSLYLIFVYSFEGKGMEYRFTLQVTLPLMLLLLARLGELLPIYKLRARELAVELPRRGPNFRYVFEGVLLAYGLLIPDPWFTSSSASTVADFAREVSEERVIATAWEPKSGQITYVRKDGVWLWRSERQFVLVSSLDANLEADLFVRDLMPRGYTERFIELPRQRERDEFLRRSVGDEATGANEVHTFDVRLFNVPVGHIEMTTAPVVGAPGVTHHRFSLKSVWLERLGWQISLDVDRQAQNCQILVEQLRLIKPGEANVYTSLYEIGSESRTQFSDGFRTLAGRFERREGFTRASTAVWPLEGLCQWLRAPLDASESLVISDGRGDALTLEVLERDQVQASVRLRIREREPERLSVELRYTPDFARFERAHIEFNGYKILEIR